MSIQSLADVVRHHAQQRPQNLAIHYLSDGRRWTFAELDAESNRVAQALQAEGVGAHDRVAYLDKNAPEYFTYLFGTAKLNAVSVAVNWRLAPKEMEYILNHAEAKVLVIGDEFLPQLAKMELKTIKRILVVGDAGDSGHTTFEQWLAGRANRDPNTPCLPNDTCYQLYTSGTTGLPKGVEITHDNFLGCLVESFASLGMSSQSVNLVCMPLFHIGGSGWALVGTYQGASMLLLRDVEPAAIARALPEHRVTHSFFVPAVLQLLVDVPGAAQSDYSALKAIVYGASPITEAVLVRAIKTFNCSFFQGYGLTETTGAVSLLSPEDHDPGGPRAHLLRSCGKAVAPNEIAIFNSDTMQPMADGEVGEICVRGRQNMKGYWNNPEATRNTITKDGWLRTGDAGFMRDGYLYIHDRVKDMIISGGENIYPAEIENALMKHPLIGDVAVIGVPSERWGETPKAIVVRKDKTLTEDQVISFCREHLARFKCPTSADWIDALPRNPSGKVLKTVLREPYWKGHTRRVS